jgi:hypothetical protein
MSAQAITDEVIKKLFHFNKSFIDAKVAASTLTPAGQKQPRLASWGDSNTRIMLHLLYILSFWCLLRYDEALRIQCSEVSLEFIEGEQGIRALALKLMLPFRKTNQYGGEVAISEIKLRGDRRLQTDLTVQTSSHSSCTHDLIPCTFVPSMLTHSGSPSHLLREVHSSQPSMLTVVGVTRTHW